MKSGLILKGAIGIGSSTPFFGYIPAGWHAPDCNRDDQYPTIESIGSWEHGHDNKSMDKMT